MLNPKTLILGIGNEILGDDAIGIVVARQVHAVLDARRSEARQIDLAEAALGGWRLVDLMAGYDSVVIIDAIQGGPGAIGDCYKVDWQSTKSAHLQFTHGLGLFEAIELTTRSGADMPAEIVVYAIEAGSVSEFGETLSEELEARIPALIEQIVLDRNELTVASTFNLPALALAA